MQLPDLESLWLAVANHLWQCAVVLVPLFGLGFVLRRASARTQNLLWWVSAAKLLLPLALLGRLTRVMIDAAWPGRGEALALTYGASPVATWLSPTEVWVSPGGMASAAIDPFLLLTVLWLAGGLVVAAYWLRFRGLDGGVSPLPGVDPAIRARIEAALAGMSIPGDDVVVSDRGSMPALVGLWRPRILVPRALVERLPADELRAVLLHEAAHHRRRDTLRAGALRVLLVVFYYFLPLWIVARKIRDTTELACDEWVVERGVPRDVYIRALARTVQIGIGASPALAAGGGGSPSLLRRRFERIRDSRRYRDMLRHHVVLASAIVLVAVASFYPFAPSWMLMAEDTSVSRELRRLAEGDLPIALNFQSQDFRDIIDSLATTLPIEVQYEGDLPRSMRIVNIEMKDVTAVDVLERIAVLTGVSYRVPDPYTLVVIAPHVPGVGGVTDPRVIPESRVMPEYPESARKAGVGGKVMLQARLDERGVVERVQVLRGVPGHVELEEAAIAAVMQWRYEPSTKDGEPVAILFTVVMDFKLDNNDEPEESMAM